MNNNTLGKLGGLCSILLGVSYVLVGALYLLLPADQKSAPDDLAFYTSVAQAPGLAQNLLSHLRVGSSTRPGSCPGNFRERARCTRRLGALDEQSGIPGLRRHHD